MSSNDSSANDQAMEVPTVSRVEFEGVTVSNLSDDGTSAPKYPSACRLAAEYDPEGMLCKVTEGGGSGQKLLQEFLVKKLTESAKCGRRGVIFHLDVETILLTFADEEKARKFTQMVAGIR